MQSSVLSSQLSVLQSERAGPEEQQPEGFRRDAAVCWFEEFSVYTGESQVWNH